MATITLRVIDGADRGRVYERLGTPVTIGREEGNTVQLNDDRISRYHVKIQEDNDRIILTDLDSTNGTKVNGEEIKLRILRFGDLISVGRTVLVVGSEQDIAERLAALRRGEPDEVQTISPEDVELAEPAADLGFELNWHEDSELQATLHNLAPPDLPDRLTPGQAAQLSELLEYLHLRIRDLLASGRVDEASGERRVTIAQRYWQNLIDLQARLADFLARISEPPPET